MKHLLLSLFLIGQFCCIGQVEIFTYVNDGQNVSVLRDSLDASFVVIDNNDGDTICFIEDKKFAIKSLFKNDTLCTFITHSYSEPFNRTDFFLYKKTNGRWASVPEGRAVFDESPSGFRRVSYQYKYNQKDILTFEVTENIVKPIPKTIKYTYKYDGNGNVVVTEIEE